MSIRVTIETPIAEVSAKQTKLPQVISNVLTHVSDGGIRADNDLSVLIGSFFLLSRLAAGAAHDPATFILPFRLEVKNAFLLKLLESQIPEMQMKNLAFLGKEIVFDVQPLHGLEMVPDDSIGNETANFSGFIAAVLNVVKGLQAQLELLFILLVPLRNPGVKVPAVIIKARILERDEFLNLALPFFLQIQEPDNYIRHLHAGVINVVLDVYVCSRGTQEPNKGVAQNSVAQMSDVGRFVGVDTGMFDQNFF